MLPLRLLALTCSAALLSQCASPTPPACQRYAFWVQGQERVYWVHESSTNTPSAPAKPKRPKPVVIVYHGGGDSAAGVAELTHFTSLADQQGFIVVYPEAYRHQWNDGREAFLIPSERKGIDDVAFTAAMLEQLRARIAIDPRRIYATGFSNGAIFCHALANRLSETFAAIAPVSGAMAEPEFHRFHPAAPISVLAIHGTADPSVPFHGGNVDLWAHGRTLSVNHTMELWREADRCEKLTNFFSIAPRQCSAPSSVTTSLWRHGLDHTEVEFDQINGGGHTWPGGPQYLPAFLIGPVCRDFDATAKIWDFFLKHPQAQGSHKGKP